MAITPELVVTDLAVSLSFWTDVLGFDVLYRRTDPDFAMLGLGDGQVMLEVANDTSWITAPMDRPFGRGINLEIEHPDPRALAARLDELGITPWRPLRETTYDVDGVDLVQVAVLVQDPDGYLLRFAQDG